MQWLAKCAGSDVWWFVGRGVERRLWNKWRNAKDWVKGKEKGQGRKRKEERWEKVLTIGRGGVRVKVRRCVGSCVGFLIFIGSVMRSVRGSAFSGGGIGSLSPCGCSWSGEFPSWPSGWRASPQTQVAGFAQGGVLLRSAEDPPFNRVVDASPFQLSDALGHFGAALLLQGLVS